MMQNYNANTALEIQKRDRIDRAVQRHYHEMDRRAAASEHYATLIINILCTLNGGAIIALVSFIGTRTTGHLWIGVLAIFLFGLAFSLVIFGAVMGFYFNVNATNALAQARLVPDGEDFTYEQPTLDHITATNKIRAKGIMGVYGSIAASTFGFVAFLLFLLIPAPAANKATIAPPKVAPVIVSKLQTQRPDESVKNAHQTTSKRPSGNNDAASAQTSSN